MQAVMTWPDGTKSDSIPATFLRKYEPEIRDWLSKPFNPSQQTINVGGVDLIRRDWNGVTHVAPMRPMDYWALLEWTDEPKVELLPASFG